MQIHNLRRRIHLTKQSQIVTAGPFCIYREVSDYVSVTIEAPGKLRAAVWCDHGGGENIGFGQCEIDIRCQDKALAIVGRIARQG